MDHPELSLEPLQALERQQELERRQKLVDEQVIQCGWYVGGWLPGRETTPTLGARPLIIFCQIWQHV